MGRSDTSSPRAARSVTRRFGSANAVGPGSTLVRMGESLPSQGAPARDPDHPTSHGESRSDRDTESDSGGGDDPRLINEIDALAARADPVPEAVVEAARRAFKPRRGKKPVAPPKPPKPPERDEPA
jgi:hypothetical protein